MKGTRLLFAALLAPLVFHAATADDASDIARAATRRGTTNTVSTTRKKISNQTENATQPITGASRTVSIPVSRESGASTRTGSVVSRVATKTDSRTVSARTTGTVAPRATQAPTIKVSRSATTPVSRAAKTPVTKSRTTYERAATSATRSRAATISRAGTTEAAITADTILNRNFGKCREVFYECMDEFCANKDTELGRCACSARASEFDGAKQHLSNIEDKLLDFGERLLTVNMDAEDATAMNQATEGELAFSEEDKSASKKMLDEIAKKLNTSFNDDAFDNNLNAINLSLNVDAAFDKVDSLMGATTTTKSGTALYQAALPVCREMAAEVCSADELAIAESGYQMTIEQACTTVAKTYQSKTDQAHAKVMESSALLDISRLDIHQQRNSDDILTCRRKMLDMLTDSTVCGENMGKCLDISGRYIDPTTGSAILTPELAQLSTLITRPSGTDTWSKIPSNAQFVSFLNSKKTFLEPAMENCQDISSSVWDSFLDDALAQIKLAQNAKLEEMRQSCTTLTTQCLDKATKSIQDFDARALSIFGVSADRTVNAMCSDIKNACTALMETDTSESGTDTTNDWDAGMTAIAQDKTYETILQTCREIGRNCITNTCKSATGNFDLCTSITRAVNRKSILNRSACWNEVYSCVASAGEQNVYNILVANNRIPTRESGDLYQKLYGNVQRAPTAVAQSDGKTETKQVYDFCQKCNSDTDCAICRLTEEIWGNCEYPSDEKEKENDHNKIITMAKNATNETLLSWFAYNTNTENNAYSCYDAATCDPGMTLIGGNCVDSSNITTDGIVCTTNQRIKISETLTNCCTTGTIDSGGNCCMNSSHAKPQKSDYLLSTENQESIPEELCGVGNNTDTLIATYKDNNNTVYIVCINGSTQWNIDTENSTTENPILATCDGTLVKVTKSEKNQITYTSPSNAVNAVEQYYNTSSNTKCTAPKYDNNDSCSTQTPKATKINYITTTGN